MSEANNLNPVRRPNIRHEVANVLHIKYVIFGSVEALLLWFVCIRIVRIYAPDSRRGDWEADTGRYMDRLMDMPEIHANQRNGFNVILLE